MDQTGGWLGGQMTIWAVLAVLLVVVVVLKSLFRKK
jgi:disulfide bond formation protein DsbB